VTVTFKVTVTFLEINNNAVIICSSPPKIKSDFSLATTIRAKENKMSEKNEKSIGQAIDEIVNALQSIDPKMRTTAVRAACEIVEVELAPLQKQVQTERPFDQSQSVEKTENTPQTAKTHIDIRKLKEQKQPSNAQEMACLVAYYLQEVVNPDERKTEINSADLDKYFKQADFPLPKKMVQVLVDAKASGYLDSTGRGVYKLNPVGYNLAAHGLPRKSSVK
jgi:hypothetical protein